MVQDRAIQWQTNRKSRDLSNGAIFSDLEGTLPRFKVTPLFAAEYLRNGTRYRHSFNGILTMTYTRHSQQCHVE